MVVGGSTWAVLRNFSHVYNVNEWEYGPNTDSVLDAAAGIRDSAYVPQDPDAEPPGGATDLEVAQWLSGWLAFAWDANDELLEKKLRYVRKTTNWLIWQAVFAGVALIVLAMVLVLGLERTDSRQSTAIAREATEVPSARAPGAGAGPLQPTPLAGQPTELPSAPAPGATAGGQ